MRRVAVLGGGIAGLAATYELLKGAAEESLPLEVHLVEREDRLGGTILTERVDGFVIEGGPDCLLAEKPWALELARELGLGGRIVPASVETQGTYILWRGRLHRLPEGFILLAPTSLWPFVISRLLSPLGKLRVALEPLIPRRRDGGDESLADFVSRRLGREVLERIAEPLVAGIHGGAPEVLSLKSTFPKFSELEAKYGSLIRGLREVMRRRRDQGMGTPFVSFRQGMAELVEALEGAIGEGAQIHLSSSAQAVERGGRGFLVHTSTGTFEVEALILATPSYVSARLLQPLKADLARLLEGIPYVSSVTLSLAFAEEEVEELRGHGFVVPRKEGLRLMAVTFSSQKFPGRAPQGKVLLRAFVGGARDEEVVELGDGEILELVLGELEGVLGLKGEPFLWRLFRWPKALAQYRVGHGKLMKEVEGKLRDTPGVFLAGGAYHGIGIGDCVRGGREAARRLLTFLRN